MATTTTNFGWDIPQSTDLVKDGATAIAALGQDIDTALIDLKGGTTGQVLSKASGTDLDYSWVTTDDTNAIQNAIVDAKGDLIGATAADTPARLAVGTNGQVLTADSTAATGIKWATPAGGGKVLQVVYGSHSTETSVTSATYVDTGLTATITPSSATSKVLVIVAQYLSKSGNIEGKLKLVRAGTDILTVASSNLLYTATTLVLRHIPACINYLDSPATTSATVYKTQFASDGSTLSSNIGSSATSQIILMEIGA
jgi:hypothetical protein